MNKLGRRVPQCYDNAIDYRRSLPFALFESWVLSQRAIVNIHMLSTPVQGGSQKGGFQKGGFGGCPPGTKTGTRVHSPKPPFWKPPFYLPVSLFGLDKRVVSKRVVLADVPPEGKPEREYIRQNHPFTKPPFYLPVTVQGCIVLP